MNWRARGAVFPWVAEENSVNLLSSWAVYGLGFEPEVSQIVKHERKLWQLT